MPISRVQLLEERLHFATPQLTADEHLPGSINAVHLKDKLRDVETDCLTVRIIARHTRLRTSESKGH